MRLTRISAAVAVAASFAACDGTGPRPVSPLVVFQDSPSLFAGDTLQLSVRLLTSAGDTVVPDSVEWRSHSGFVASVSPTGLVNGTAPGMATVVARHGADTAQVEVAVLTVPVPRVNRGIAYIRRFQGALLTLYEVRYVEPGSPSIALTEPDPAPPSFSWSPDGERIAVNYYQAGPDADFIDPARVGSWVRSFDGKEEIKLSAEPGFSDWAPDGTARVLKATFGSESGLFVISRDARSRFVLTRDSSDQQPAWSPDGRRIAFVRRKTELWAVRSYGENARLIYASPRNIFGPAWSPDGRHLAFLVSGPPGNGIYVVAADGTNPRPISSNCDLSTCSAGAGSVGATPTWVPDGVKVMYPIHPGVHEVTAPINLFRTTVNYPCGGGERAGISPDWTAIVVGGCLSQLLGRPYFGPGVVTLQGSSLTLIAPYLEAYAPAWRP